MDRTIQQRFRRFQCRRHRALTPLLLAVLLLRASLSVASAPVWLLDINGAIGPAVADYTVRGLQQAEAEGASLVVLNIDTPGGFDQSMRRMIQAILRADIPVVGYVAPRGARAASAGTYLLYACHIAAMAPATNLGAATPVQMGTPSPLPASDGSDRAGDEPAPGASSPSPPASAMQHKIINDATAYIQSLAELRGRNAEWATKAVTEGASLSATAALKQNVIDLMANDLSSLLAQLDGRRVALDGQTVTLSTTGATVHRHPMGWRSQFLAIITDPNIAYILIMIGIYGLIFEFSNPGIGLPGIAGAVCLLLAMYALQVLPISYAGLGLMLLGIGLMTAEAFAPSFGVLGLGGVVAFAIGSVFLMDTDLPGYQIAMPLIAGVTLFSALLLIAALGLILKARRRAHVSGVDTLIGATATVESVHKGEAFVRLQGERWHVQSATPLVVNDSVIVDEVDGLTLRVKKAETERGQ